ncbi:hypothetical protein [Natronobacterium texcoconense]|uniref:hypothetical protein n=1 Tax=Natronobacterium texcoconense TaxID=1095778 RepID=UPI001113AB6D|nr:hypothetical protein [Natronobacterium texcoconense]
MERRQAIKTIGGTVAGLSVASIPAAASSGDYEAAYEAVHRNFGRQYAVEIELEWSVTGGEVTDGSVSDDTATSIDWSFEEWTERDTEQDSNKYEAYSEAKFEGIAPVIGSTERLGFKVTGLTGGDTNTSVMLDTRTGTGRTVINEI